MTLLQDLLDEKDRRASAEAPVEQPKTGPRDYSIPRVAGDRFKTGVAQGVKSVGTGIQAVGTSLQHPDTVLTTQEYVEKHSGVPAYGGSPNLQAARSALRRKSPTREQSPQALKSPFPASGDGPVSVLTGDPLEPKIFETRRLRKDEMLPVQKFVSGKVAPVVKGLGEPITEYADKVIEDNPQWRLPEHLRGRGVLESMSADDLSFRDKATMLIGGIAQNTPQVVASMGLPLAGGLVAGPPGLVAGVAASAGGNFLNMSGEVYEELKRAHPLMPEEDLANVALAHGTLSAALEFIPQASLITKIPGLKKAFQRGALKELAARPSLAKGFVSGIATQGATEGITEALQTVSANIAKRVFDENQGLLEGVDEATFMGVIMGSLTGGVVSMGSHPSAVRQYNLEKVGEMSVSELSSLVNDPSKLAEQGVSRAEAISTLRQAKAIERYERSKGTPPSAPKDEKALLEKDTSERKLAVQTLRDANLPDSQLESLKGSPDQLEQYGLNPQDITSIQGERSDEQSFVTNFSATLDSAPSEAIRKGMLSTLQGEYYSKLTEQAAVPEEAVVSPEQAAVPEEAVVSPEQAAVPEEAVVSPEEAVVSPEQAAVPEEAVVSPEQAAAPEEAVVSPEQAAAPKKIKVNTFSKGHEQTAKVMESWLKEFSPREGVSISVISRDDAAKGELSSVYKSLPPEVQKRLGGAKTKKALSNKRVRGLMAKLKTETGGKHYMIVADPIQHTGSVKDVQNVSTYAHEVGHIIDKEYLRSAPINLQAEVIKSYKAWRKAVEPSLAKRSTLRKERKVFAHIFDRPDLETQFKKDSKVPTGKTTEDYVSSFDEWFADQVAKSLTTSEKPIGAIEEFFKNVAESLRSMLERITGTQFMPDPVVRDFVLGGDLFIKRYSDNLMAQDKNSEFSRTLRENLKNASEDSDLLEYDPSDPDVSEILQDLFQKPPNKADAEATYNQDFADAPESLDKANEPELRRHTERLEKAKIKEYERTKNTQEVGKVELLVSSPEYYFTQDSTTHLIQKIASDKASKAHMWRHDVQGDLVPVISSIKKADPQAYTKGKRYLINSDVKGEGFTTMEVSDGWLVLNPKGEVVSRTTTEKEAVYGPKGSIELEGARLKDLGYSPNAVDLVKESRLLTNRAFDLHIEDMRQQVKDAKDRGYNPPMANTEEGKISLAQAIIQMGDLRGSYFPRVRENKGYVLRAKSDKAYNVLETFEAYVPGNVKDPQSLRRTKRSFNAKTPLGKRVRELESQGYTDISIEPSRNLSRHIYDTQGLIASMDSLLSAAEESTKSTSDTDAKLLEEAHANITYQVADLFKIKGNLGSRKQRVSEVWKGYEEDPLVALTEYSRRVATSAAMRDTARRMLLVFTGREVSWESFQEENPGAAYSEYMKSVRDKAVDPVHQKELYGATRDYMSYILSPKTAVDAAVSKLQALAIMKYLGFRVSSAAANMTNLGIAVPATISAHSGVGIRESWKRVLSASGKYSLYRLNQLENSSIIPEAVKKKIQSSADTVLTEQDRGIFDEISRRGWDEENFSREAQEVLQSNTSRYFENTLEVMMYAFGATEKANRAVTIFAAYKAHEKAAKKNNKPSNPELFYALSHHTSNRAHGQYGEAAKPWLIQKHRILNLPYTFKKFQHNFLLNLHEIGVKGYQQGKGFDAAKNIAYLLLAPAIVAGAGASLVSQVSFGMLSALTGSDDAEEDFYKWVDDTFGEGDMTSRAARHGLGGLAGVSLKGTLAFDNPLPANISELAGAGGSVVTDLWDSAIHVSQGELLRGTEKALPSSIGAFFKAYRETTEGVTDKNLSPRFYGTEPIKANLSEAITRGFGFSPSRLATISEKQWSETKVVREYAKERTRIKRNIHKMLSADMKSKEAWASVLQEVREYNVRANEVFDRYHLPFINDVWIRGAIRSYYTPSKTERLRRVE